MPTGGKLSLQMYRVLRSQPAVSILIVQAILLILSRSAVFSAEPEKSGDQAQTNHIAVTTPKYCSEVTGTTTIRIAAPGFKSITAKCWKQGPGFGTDSTLATITPGPDGSGAFVFPAESYPHGPITIRISGEHGGRTDNCYLQLYNRSGISWKEGIPKQPPAAAKGMSLVFADDFNGPLSISRTDPAATYYDHKPGGGDFSSLP